MTHSSTTEQSTTAVSSTTPTRAGRPSCFDAEGNHISRHGKPVMTSYTPVARKFGAPPLMEVLTRFATRRKAPPAVVLAVSDLPFVLDWPMSPQDARTLAANLLEAAEVCEKLATLVPVEGMAP